MVREKKTKYAVLILSAAIMIIAAMSSVSLFDATCFAVMPGASAANRCTYHFVHANIFHAMTNVWCLLSLTFYYDIKARDIIIAYAIATLYPVDTLAHRCQSATLPTVGLSALCFALMGMTFWRVRRKAYYFACVTFIIALGALVPHINTPIHLYSYVAGLMVGILFMPVR